MSSMIPMNFYYISWVRCKRKFTRKVNLPKVRPHRTPLTSIFPLTTTPLIRCLLVWLQVLYLVLNVNNVLNNLIPYLIYQSQWSNTYIYILRSNMITETSLFDCLKLYFKEEEIDDTWKCELCNKISKPVKR